MHLSAPRKRYMHTMASNGKILQQTDEQQVRKQQRHEEVEVSQFRSLRVSNPNGLQLFLYFVFIK